MAEIFASPDHLETLQTSALNIEIYAQPALMTQAVPITKRLQILSPHLVEIFKQEGIFKILNLDPDRHTLEVELTWVDNMMMRSLNRDYRQKDSPTDVLTFPLISTSDSQTPWLHLPAIQLGSIFISLEWAEQEVRANPGWNLERYLLERFIHGMLHLLGQHHDTMAAYERVVSIQQRILDEAFGT